MIYYAYMSKKVTEGGMARNKAFYDYFLDRAIIINLFSASLFLRLLKIAKACFQWFYFKDKTILIHQGTFFLMFPEKLLKQKAPRKIALYLLQRVSLRNNVYFEVNDLRFEQAISLQLNADLKLLESIQIDIFSYKALNFIFASKGLEDFAVKSYHVDQSKCQTIINGGNVLSNATKIPDIDNFSNLFKSDKINFVYAGSLNKGRQIETMLKIFQNKPGINLILMGAEGEWIKKIANNLFYLGDFEEILAHHIVAKCDVGIIPYDARKLYYNICYPTKVSFYISAGIGTLSTPLDTLKDMYQNDTFINFCDINDWDTYLNELTAEKILKMKENARDFRKEIYWQTLLSKINFNH